MRVVFDENNFGITQKSLKAFRNALSYAAVAGDEVGIVEVPTGSLCCGFLVVTRITNSAVFTGDGFRTDGGGEGGAGYRSALGLVILFGGSPSWILRWETAIDVSVLYSGNSDAVRTILAGIAEKTKGLIRYWSPVDAAPRYLRGGI